MIKAIIFDCFGVIYPDTIALVERRFLDPKDELKKVAIKNLRLKSDAGGLSRDEFWRGAARILGVRLDELEAELDRARGADWELLEYIRALKQRFKTALLSNVGKGFLERIFDTNRPAKEYFDVIIASADIGALKPDPKAYMAVVARLKVEPSECIFIDDKLMHCKGAEAVGMRSLIYRDFEQMKGKLESLLAKVD